MSEHVHEDNRCCFCGLEDDHECRMCPAEFGSSPLPAQVEGNLTKRLTPVEFEARGLARSQYHDRLFAASRPRPTNEQFDEGWESARLFYSRSTKAKVEKLEAALLAVSHRAGDKTGPCWCVADDRVFGHCDKCLAARAALIESPDTKEKK